MSRMVAADLLAGIIYGDNHTGEYVYLPAGEVGMAEPLCVLETETFREDLTLDRAVEAVRRRSLTPVSHPKYGRRSY